MQLFNRTGTEATINCEFNSNVYNGDTRGVKGRFSLTIPHCLFVAFCTKNGLEDYSKGIILQIFTDTQLSNTDRSFTLTYDNENLTSTSITMELGETYVDSFTNDMSGTTCRAALKNDDIAKANTTATEKPLYMYTATMVNRLCGYASDYNTIPDQTDFKLLAEGVPCICFEATYTYPAGVFNNLCHGHYLTRTDGTGRLNIADYYYTEDCYTSWMSAPNYGNNDYNNYCRAQMFWLWVVANGDIDTDFDITDPFQPFPSDFYIEVTAQSDGEDKGEQGINFSWQPQNIEELSDIDLQNVNLTFDFYIGDDYEYKVTVPYAQDGYSTNFRTLYEMMGVPFYKNILNKLPLPESWNDTNIYCSIWWSDVTGDAGKCLYVIGYDGNNTISVDKAQDTETGYWTYLVSDQGDGGQDYNPDPNPYEDLSDFGGGTDAVNGSALLTTSYALSVSGAHDFGNWLWGTGFDLSQLKMVVNNPIENIVSCKLFPFGLTGTQTTVKLGNVSSPVSGYLLPENVARTFDLGDVTIPKKYNSFLDYAPYTNVRIYLPYLGLHEIETDIIMGNTINVKYYVDLVTGHCRAIIFLKETNSLKKIQQIDGMIGQDVPVVGSNRAQVEAGYIVGGAQAVASFASGIGAAITGNIGAGLADIGGAVKGGLQTAMQQYHTYTSGTPSPALSRFDEQKVCVFVDRPVYTKPEKFEHQNGLMCNLTKRLGTLHGYTVVDNTVDLSGIPCNKHEREMLLQLLTSGVYL